MSTTNPAYAKHEHVDGGEIEPGDLHRRDSNLSIDKEEQKYINKVPEDNVSNTVGDDVQPVVEDENGYESAAEDSKFNIGGGSVGGALRGYAGVDDEDHIEIY